MAKNLEDVEKAIREIGFISKVVRDGKALAAAGDYGAEDVLSESATAGTAYTFDGMAEKNGGSGTIEKAIELEPDYVVYNIGTLFPGTREYEKRVEAGEVDRSIWDRYLRGEAPLPVISRGLDRAELSAYLRAGYSRFYLRSRYILKKLGSMRSARDVLVLARQARTVVADYVIP